MISIFPLRIKCIEIVLMYQYRLMLLVTFSILLRALEVNIDFCHVNHICYYYYYYYVLCGVVCQPTELSTRD